MSMFDYTQLYIASYLAEASADTFIGDGDRKVVVL